MAHLARGAVSSAANPLLDIWVSGIALLADPDAGSLAFTVNDISTEEKEMVPVVTIATTLVDLVVDRLGTDVGHFAAAFTVPSAEPEGLHEIVWTWTLLTVPYTYVQRFDVLPGVPRGYGTGGYGLVSDFRAEGLSVASATTLRLLKLIIEQSAYIDEVLGQFFEPRFLDMNIDGTNSRKLIVGAPIIALLGFKMLTETITLDPLARELVVYNRHLRGMLEPDDRRAPRIEVPENFPFFDTLYGTTQVGTLTPSLYGFPKTSQNVKVIGLFGYTDPDGTNLGRTPFGIRKALMLLVRRNLPTLACDTDGFDIRMANRVTSMTTRDQSISFAAPGLGAGVFTGDQEIDNLLSRYKRPIRMYAT